MKSPIWTPADLALSARYDSSQTASISRDLTYVFPTMFDVLRTPNRAREVIPVDYSVPAGAESFTYQINEGVGSATWSNDRDPAARNDAKTTEATVPVKMLRASWEYTLQDQRAEELRRRNLLERKGRAARESIETALSTAAISGDTSVGLGGFLNATGVSNAAATNGSWASAALDDVIEDIVNVIATVRTQSQGRFEANAVVLPLSVWNALEKPRAQTDTSVLSWIKSNFPGVQFTWLNELETAGTGSTKMMIAYKRDPMVVSLNIAAPDFEVLPPMEYPDGLEFIARLRTAGTTWFHPLGGAQAYGL